MSSPGPKALSVGGTWLQQPKQCHLWSHWWGHAAPRRLPRCSLCQARHRNSLKHGIALPSSRQSSVMYPQTLLCRVAVPVAGPFPLQGSWTMHGSSQPLSTVSLSDQQRFRLKLWSTFNYFSSCQEPIWIIKPFIWKYATQHKAGIEEELFKCAMCLWGQAYSSYDTVAWHPVSATGACVLHREQARSSRVILLVKAEK